MIEERLSTLVRMALGPAAEDLGVDLPADLEVEISTPKQKGFGDFSTNVALVLGRRRKRSSAEVAAALVKRLPADAYVTDVQIAGPGFVNFWVTNAWLHDVLRDVVAQGEAFGRQPSNGASIQVEFVSANPTGPLHIGQARNAVIGDVMANLFDATGWRVEREYYWNDAGRQMELFGESVEARYLQLLGREASVPEEGYHGDYLVDVAKDVVAENGDAFADLTPDERRARLLHEGAVRVLAMIDRTLERFGVGFDSYFSERTLHEKGEIAEAVDRLRAAGLVFDHEGAVFFRSTEFGDDKDRVLIRSSGAPTYFAADCAYLLDKFRRGFDHLVYVWGADHHGDVARVKGAAEALGFDPDAVEMILYQWVSLTGVGMSKRAGTFISLDELLDEVGADATRFALLSRSNDATIEFDIDAVKRQSMENPVYYVQYGHARIASILRNAAARGVALRPIDDVDLDVLAIDPELDLLRKLAETPKQIREAAEFRAPHRLTHFAQDLAAQFHRFYTECRVLTEDDALTQARLWLSTATKQVIANVLGLIGVSAPEAMERTDA
jgi:arginyl-tRNA synthetase